MHGNQNPDDEQPGAGRSILSAIYRCVGRMEGRVERMEANLDLLIAEGQRHGRELAVVQTTCADRGRRISGLEKVIEHIETDLRRTEDTGQIIIAERDTKFKVLALTGKIITGVVAAAAASFGIATAVRALMK